MGVAVAVGVADVPPPQAAAITAKPTAKVPAIIVPNRIAFMSSSSLAVPLQWVEVRTMVWPRPLGEILQLTDSQKPNRLIFGSITWLMIHRRENPTRALPYPRVTFGPHSIRSRYQGVENLISLLRQSVSSLLAGYNDTDDAERLAQDPAMKVVVG